MRGVKDDRHGSEPRLVMNLADCMEDIGSQRTSSLIDGENLSRSASRTAQGSDILTIAECGL